tara:strand:- start:8594 stop:8971 length:378 start_codon:yes stop_codon:yes gene_type:complete
METELELGGFYTCVQDDLDPVVIWIGRVDLPADLGMGAKAPVVSLVVKGAEDGTPVISHAPFWESFALGGEIMDADPFNVDEEGFADNYNIWRDAYDAGDAQPWAMTPNEVYGQMMEEIQAEIEG